MATNFFDIGNGSKDVSDSSSEDSSDGSSCVGSCEEAEEGKTDNDTSKSMMSALEAFKQVEGPPEFLKSKGKQPVPTKEKKRKTADIPTKEKTPVVIAVEPLTYKKPRIPDATFVPKSEEETDDKDKDKDSRTDPMAVDEFLNKGGGMLPRRSRKQRDKEKLKREKGQSAHSVLKSEEEMVLRQQYD